MNYYVEWDFREKFEKKSDALRRAAAIAKFYRGVVKVYYRDVFIKSFDGRK